jgi:hypothetical protein
MSAPVWHSEPVVITEPLNFCRLGPGDYQSTCRRVGVVVSVVGPDGGTLWSRPVRHHTRTRIALPLPFFDLRLQWTRDRAADVAEDLGLTV